MPVVNKANVSVNGYWNRTYLSFLQETVIYSRAVDNQTFDYPMKFIKVHNPYSGIGSHTDLLPDMEIIVYYGNTQSVKGRLRVRGSYHLTDAINVNEFSVGTLSLAVNDRIDVVRSWMIRPRLPAADLTFAPDFQSYSDQHSDPAPIACSGGAYANWKHLATAVRFDGTLSRTIDVDSTAGVSHSWTFPPGASPATSTATAPIVDLSAVAAGTHWVTHAVTDVSNGKTTTQRVPVRLHDAGDPPIELVGLNMSASVESEGWTATFTIYDDIDISQVPDRAMVICWSEEFYGDTRASYGSAIDTRHHIKFVGFLNRETIRRDEDEHTLTFEAIGPVGVLSHLPGFSTVLLHNFNPADWFEVRRLDTNQAILYRLRELTTIENICDIELPPEPLTYPRFYVQQATPYQQIIELAEGVDSKFIGDRLGRARVVRPVYYRSNADRNTAVTIMTLDEDDLLDIEVQRDHRFPYNQVEGRAINSSNFEAEAFELFSRSPGLAPSDAPSSTVVDRMIASWHATGNRAVAQNDLNVRTGFRYARLNRLFYNQPAAQVVATLRGGYDVFDPAFVDEWVKIDGVTLRRRSLNNVRFTIENVNVVASADEGTKTVTLTLQEETNGAPGETLIYPQSPAINIEPPPPPSELPEPFPMPITNPINISAPTLPYSIFVVGLNEVSGATKVVHLRNIALSPVSATVVDLNSAGVITGDGRWASSDPFDYRRKFVLTTNGLWRIDDVTVPTTPVLVATNAQMFGSASANGSQIEMSINRQGYMIVSTGSSATEMGFAISFNYGASWELSKNPLDNLSFTPGTAYNSASPAVSPFNGSGPNGVVYTGTTTGTANPYVTRIFRSENWGRTWSLIHTLNTNWDNSQPRVQMPYYLPGGIKNINSSAQSVWVARGDGTGGGGVGRIMRFYQNNWAIYTSNGSAQNTMRGYSKWAKRPFNFYTTTDRVRMFSISAQQDGNMRFWVSDIYGSEGFLGQSDVLITSSQAPHHFGVGFQNRSDFCINGWPTNPTVLLAFSAGSVGTATGTLVYIHSIDLYPPSATAVSLASLLPSFTDNRVVYAEFDLGMTS